MKSYFVCVGLQKAGTTWLSSVLAQQRDIGVIRNKEAHYFDRSISYPSTNRFAEALLINRLVDKQFMLEAFRLCTKYIMKADFNSVRWYVKYYFSTVNDSWYLSLFPDKEPVLGDFTPAYSFLKKDDIGKMRQTLKLPKVIICLRNPIERAWSHYRFDHPKQARLGVANPEKMLSHFIDFINSDKQTMRNDIPTIVSNYREFFEGNMLLVFFDAIINNPDELINEVLNFLDVEHLSASVSTLTAKKNKSKSLDIPESYLNFLVDKYSNDLSWLSDNIGGYCAVWKNKYSFMHSKIPSDSICIQNTINW